MRPAFPWLFGTDDAMERLLAVYIGHCKGSPTGSVFFLILNALNLVGTSTDALALHTKLVDAIERGDEDDAQDQILKHLALSMRNFEYSLQVGARRKKA